MRQSAAGRCGNSLPGQRFSARHIGSGSVGHISCDTAREVDRQEALCLDGPGIESQRAIEQANRLGIGLARLQRARYGRSAENVVKGVGIAAWPGGLSIDQLDAERDRNPPCDVVFQGEQIADVTVKLLGR
jgi:hypothetical protein